MPIFKVLLSKIGAFEFILIPFKYVPVLSKSYIQLLFLAFMIKQWRLLIAVPSFIKISLQEKPSLPILIIGSFNAIS